MPPDLAWSSLHLFEHQVLPEFAAVRPNRQGDVPGH